MKIASYTLCYNESFMLPYFVDHYRNFVDRMVVYDNQSTDGSAEIARKLGVNAVRTLDTGGQIRDDITKDLRNNCWKELRGQGFDWVMIVDMDEFVCADNTYAFLAECSTENVTMCIPQGHQMVGKALPAHSSCLTYQIRTGYYEKSFSKPVIFNPDKISEINLVAGAHRAAPLGDLVVDVSGRLQLLHYHWLTADWVKQRNEWRKTRLSPVNAENGWGREYNNSPEVVQNNYKRMLRKCFDVFTYEPTGSERRKNLADRKTRLISTKPIWRVQ